MNKFEIDKAYVSEYDKFIAKFDSEHEMTASQLREKTANAKIAALRDGTEPVPQTDSHWDEF